MWLQFKNKWTDKMSH